MTKVSIADKLSQFSDYFNPRIVGELNGQHVKLVKFQGESSGITTSTRTNCFWWSKADSGWTSAIVRNGSKKANS